MNYFRVLEEMKEPINPPSAPIAPIIMIAPITSMIGVEKFKNHSEIRKTRE
jgi:hypothetical protein